jgi:hypothetical protein
MAKGNNRLLGDGNCWSAVLAYVFWLDSDWKCYGGGGEGNLDDSVRRENDLICVDVSE